MTSTSHSSSQTHIFNRTNQACDMPIALTPPLSPSVSHIAHPQILYIDAYDSFSNSIVGLLRQSLDADVTIVRIDDVEVSKHLDTILKAFDAVVVGPGPGHPAIPNDVGLINQLWKLDEVNLLPIFGICLGFQSLCLAYGGEVKRLCQARHGIVSKISHNGTAVFEDITQLHATQYHSLRVELGSVDLHGDSLASPYWKPTFQCPELQPLAWDTEDDLNGPVLMSVRHTTKPFSAIQFHPESICTSYEGGHILENWWKQAEGWLIARKRRTVKNRNFALGHINPVTTSLSTPRGSVLKGLSSMTPSICEFAKALHSKVSTRCPRLSWTKYSTPSISPAVLVESLGLTREEVILLDSQDHSMGRFSILGIVIPDQTVKVTYKCWDKTLRYGTRSTDDHVAQLHSIDQIWPMLQETLDLHNPKVSQNVTELPCDSPFWGGFLGYISYEAGLEMINVDLHESCATSRIPDLNFAFVQRSIVMDHVNGETYVQSLLLDDSAWMSEAGKTLNNLIDGNASRNIGKERSTSLQSTEVNKLEERPTTSRITTPQGPHYRTKVVQCQSSLAAGDSYELCLTDETLITFPNTLNTILSPWSLYKKLRRRNPAPYGAFLHLSDATLVGTSPERFLKWTRTGHCQFRPIKGTVKKSTCMTREMAHDILKSSKEQAENLMIVDLIRHDLAGVIGAENCTVSKLMTVEEYEHVYQLVSVIEGQLPKNDNEKGMSGLDVLKASLPPGSMTGAPKKRSCEILRDIEKRPRGIYSGVLGYMDVGGGGDFSVVIRSAVRDLPAHSFRANSNDEEANDASLSETWRIGAGGAVTIQSTDEGEYLEMNAKLMTALTAFQSV